MPGPVTMREALAEAGRELQPEYDPDPIPWRVLREKAAAKCGRSKDSILPSDYCYNLTNDGIGKDNDPIFLHCGIGRYRFVGPNYPYTGPIMHYPKGQPSRQVGEWVNGKRIYF